MGNLLTSIKDPVNIKFQQGVVYSIQYRNCNKRYIGEIKRILEIRQKEHKADVENRRVDKSALIQCTFE